MRRALLTGALLTVALLAVAPPAVRADETHRPELRIAYVEHALAALRATPTEALARANDYAHVLGRSSCASSVPRLQVECLMTAGRTFCKKSDDAARCGLDMDVIVARMLGDAQLISTEKRYQIMTHTKDYRRELARESRRLAGALAADFHLRTGAAASDAELSRNIDRYCLASGDENAMPWQSCVASLVWFVVTETRAAASAESEDR